MIWSVRLALTFLAVSALGSLFAAESAEVSLLRAKAEKGNALAQYNLGLAYAEGQGVPVDLPEAFVWLSLASENGSTGKALDTVLGNITDQQLTEGRRRLAACRAALASRATTISALGQNPARKPFTRGFSLTPAPSAAAPAPDDDVPVTKPPASATSREPRRPDEPAADDLTVLRNENTTLKAELARSQDQLRDQAATIVRLARELSARNAAAGVAHADSPRTSPADGTTKSRTRP